MKLYAMPRAGGPAILIDDAPTHGSLAALADLALDASDLYWTVPAVLDGVWNGALFRRRLPDGAQELVAQAPHRSIIGWPSAREGSVAYEVVSQDGEAHVEYRRGEVSEALPISPATEPVLGDGYVVVKRAGRFDQGALAAFILSTGAVVDLGAGDLPFAYGPVVVWRGNPPDASLRIAMPAAGCEALLTRNPGYLQGNPAVGDSIVSWISTDPTLPRGRDETVRIFGIERFPC